MVWRETTSTKGRGMNLRRSKVVAVLSLMLAAGALAAAPTALANVVIGQSIYGVKLGDTLTQLRERFPHVRVETIRGETSFFVLGLRGGLSRSHRITGFYTADSGQKTSRGVHTGAIVGGRQLKGSSVAAVEKAYPSAKCTKPGQPEPDSVICTLNSRYHGRAVSTSFVFYSPSQGVAEIGIGYAATG